MRWAYNKRSALAVKFGTTNTANTVVCGGV